MPDWKRYINRKNAIMIIPWLFLIVYAWVIRGMAIVLNDVMDGDMVVDPVWTNMQLTMQLSFWVTIAMIAVMYIVVRHACRLAAGVTNTQRISALERRVEDLESDDTD